MSPSDEKIKQEFLAKYPDSEIISKEFIFEQDYIETYLVKYKGKSSDEIKMSDFSLKRKNFIWRACDDQTEEKCK